MENTKTALPACQQRDPRLWTADRFLDVIVSAATADYVYSEERFFLVAEVISPSNTAEMIGRKLELYRSHPENLYCLTVDRDCVHLALYARESGWAATHLRAIDDVLRLPSFGFAARLPRFTRARRRLPGTSSGVGKL